MNDKDKEILKQYEDYKLAIKDLEEKCNELKPQILEIIPEDAKVDTGIGVFIKASRKTWKYSDDIMAREKQLKEDKKTEEQTGAAEATDGVPYIVYKSKS